MSSSPPSAERPGFYTVTLGCKLNQFDGAAIEGELPKVFGKEHPVNETPVGAAVLMGIVSTVILASYGILAKTNVDLFWSLFAFSAVIFLQIGRAHV